MEKIWKDLKILILTGPTASGKTETLSFLKKNIKTRNKSEASNIDIISADAFQVYRGMNIGTAKPTQQFLQKVPHKLIDILNPDEIYSAGSFFKLAENEIEKSILKGSIPIVSGGTAMYLSCLINGIVSLPKIDKKIRLELVSSIERLGLEALYSKLQSVDNTYAKKISSNDTTRIIRALEVYEALGISFTESHKKYHQYPRFKYKVLVIKDSREDLYSNINQRVLDMMDEGWLEEVEALKNKGYGAENHSFNAIGYRQLYDVIMGEATLDDSIDNISQKTRNFAKRQMTWLNNMECDKSFFTKDSIRHEAFKYIDETY